MTVGLTTRTIAGDAHAAADAARCLEDGGLVAFPTETVYGLGADATNADAVARLYQAKGRPSFNPLIAHVESVAAALDIAVFDGLSLRLANTFWPGPLTLVLRKTTHCPVAELATAGLDTIAVRVPAHPIARDILRALGKPVVAPSANISGHVSPTTAAHVESDLAGRIDLIVDGGPVAVGVESTIISCLGEPMLLRPGGLPRAAIEAVLGKTLLNVADDADVSTPHPLAPGMLEQHYAPRTPLRLNATRIEAGEAVLAFGKSIPAGLDQASIVLNLSERGDPVEAAANLFGHLRTLDAKGASGIAAMTVPMNGLGEAINDRLRRAAVPATSIV